MRKFYIRWWYAPQWRGDRLMQAIREWSNRESWQDECESMSLNPGLREMLDSVDVALHRVRHRLPYTGSGDLFDPYR